MRQHVTPPPCLPCSLSSCKHCCSSHLTVHVRLTLRCPCLPGSYETFCVQQVCCHTVLLTSHHVDLRILCSPRSGLSAAAAAAAVVVFTLSVSCCVLLARLDGLPRRDRCVAPAAAAVVRVRASLCCFDVRGVTL